MNLAAVYGHITAAEERFDVTDLRLADVNVWLPARDIFVRPFFEYRLQTYKAVLRATSHTDPLSWELLRDHDLAFSTDVTYHHRSLGDIVLFNKHGETYGESYGRPVDVLVYHAFTDYGEEVAGKAFNRVNDGVVELAPDRDRVVKLMRANATAPLLPYYNPTHFYQELHRPWRDPSAAGSEEEALLARMRDMAAWARGEGIPHVYEPHGFLARLRTMLWRAGNFQQVLRYFAPRSVFLSSYSNIERMAMILACWREGVPVVDVEHGFMGPYSPYGRLGFVPAEGVRVLPSWFWCWGQENRAFIERSLGDPGKPHTPLVGGSTWHRARRQLVATGMLEDERPALLPEDYVQRLRDARRVVYFCWQPDMLVHDEPPSLLPAHFLEAAGSSDSDVLFCIRLHPRSHHLIGRFEALLRRHGVASWEIECSTRYPLLDILPLTDVLLTSYSTVAFEANELGVPVILVDAFGADMMRDYVHRGVFHTATDAESLRRLCEGLDRAGVTKVPYASDDPDAHVRAFATILESGPPAEGPVAPAQHTTT